MVYNSAMFKPLHPFIRAVDLVGGKRMAIALKVSPQAVSKMRKLAVADSSYLVPSNHLRAIEIVTEGQVSVADLLDVASAQEKEAA